MRKNENETRPKSSLGKRILVATLAMSMALSGTAYAGMNNAFKTKAAETTERKYGDVDGDGKVNLNDAKLTLRAAVGVKGVTLDDAAKKAADLDFNDKVDLNDAKLVLRLAVGIIEEDDLDIPAPSTIPPYIPDENDTEPPERTPKTTFTPVSPDAASVVTGNAIEVDKDVDDADFVGYNENSYIEDYMDNQGVYAFYDNDEGKETYGMKVVNPLAGRTDFVEKVEDVISLDAPQGKKNVWSLSGASIEPVANDGTDFQAMDPMVWQGTSCSPGAVEYTIPKWTKSFTVSFWAKVKNQADPILTFTNNESYILCVRANGTVRFNSEKENKNQYDMGSTSIEGLGEIGEWTYYTITVANDWIGVYVNGQENIFDSVSLFYSEMQNFNKGFMTRMNPITHATEEMVNANEHNKYYYTKLDKSSKPDNKRAAWYYNEKEGKYMAHEEATVFGSQRFRGANGKGVSIMEFLTRPNSGMFIGGVTSTLDKSSCTHLFKEGAMFADLTFYDKELTAKQISSNYAYLAQATKPGDLQFPGKNPNVEPVEPTGGPIEVVTGASVVQLRKNGLGVNADYDEESNTFTFKEATANSGEVVGVRMDNPFASTKADDKSYIKSTIEEALTGQAIFPYKYPDDYSDSTLAGKYVSNTHESNLGQGLSCHGACDSTSVNPQYGNFYDKYFGDVYAYGNEMSNPTANLAQKTIVPLEELEKTYTGDDVHTYQRPKWTDGVTLSFWAKPTVVDDSPLITFYNSNKTSGMLLSVDTMGSVVYTSLFEAENNAGDWKSGKMLTAQGEPRNTFSTYGDASYVKANEWNYYTITIANDWIQVYVNGVEMVYKKVNFNRGEMKYFNSGYLTRYNPIGIYTDKMIEQLIAETGADTTGKTLEGTARNYLNKSGYILNTTEEALKENGYNIFGVNKSADSASIRSNGPYEDPFVNHAGSGLLMDLMTQSVVRLYIGGVDGGLTESAKFAFSDMYVMGEDIGNENIRQYPVTYVKENVMSGTSTDQKAIYIDSSTAIAVPAGTEGAVSLGINDYQGNPIFVSEACKVVQEGGAQPEGAYPLQRNTDKETIDSRRKIYSTDHTLAAGTKVSGMVSYYSELTAQEVKDAYNDALKNKPAD